MRTEEVIIGSKPVDAYISAVMYRLDTIGYVELSAIGSNIDKLERIVRMFCNFNVSETSRRYASVNKLQATIVTLKRLGNGQATGTA